MRNLLVVSFLCFQMFLSGVVAQTVSEKTKAIVKWNEAREDIYESIIRYFSPVIYHDAVIEIIKTDEGEMRVHSPFDVLVDPFFDGDSDIRNNPEALKLRKLEDGSYGRLHSLVPRIMAFVKETESHLYIELVLYHPVDGKDGSGHLNDSEKMWMVIAIDSPEFDSLDPRTHEWLFDPASSDTPHLRLEFVALEAHAEPHFYAPNADVQRRVRMAYHEYFTEYLEGLSFADKMKKGIKRRNIVNFDTNATHHHDTSAPSFLEGVWGEPANMLVFQCRTGHALYMCNPTAWSEGGKGEGYLYVCDEPGRETAVICENFPENNQASVKYSIRLMDKIVLTNYMSGSLDETSVASLANSENFAIDRSKIFDKGPTQKDINKQVETSEGVIELRPKLPRAFVRADKDSEPKATLPNDWGMNSDHTLSFPHLVHRWLDPENKDISDVYVFNPWIQFVD